MRIRAAFCVRCNCERPWRRNGRMRVCLICHGALEPGRSKYGNIPTRGPTGKLRHSRKEASREVLLEAAKRAGTITDLQAQVRFPLTVYSVPTVERLLEEVEAAAELGDPNTTVLRCQGLAGDVRRSRRKIATYIADFVYRDENGQQHVEDPKGYRTREYRMKRELFAACYDLEIEEP